MSPVRAVVQPVVRSALDRPTLPGGGAPAYVPPTVSGGEVSDVEIGGRLYRLHTFRTSGELIVSDLGDSDQARLLLVGGGGSGGRSSTNQRWPSGGAGGSVMDMPVTLALGTHEVIVGAGGAPVAANGPGLHGSQTTALGLTAIGGASGAAHDAPGVDMPGGNASGGGAWTANAVIPLPGGTGAHNGGAGGDGGGARRAAGGSAGAGGAGGDGAEGVGGDAGVGVQSDITGESAWYGVGSPGSAGSTSESAGQTAPGGVPGTLDAVGGGESATTPGSGGAAAIGVDSGAGADGLVVLTYPLEAA